MVAYVGLGHVFSKIPRNGDNENEMELGLARVIPKNLAIYFMNC